MPVSFDEVADGPTNMARDLELLARAESDGQVWARVYGWSGPWVTLGRFQNPERDLVPGCPVPWVKRPTGGRGVLHGHDITVGLAGPLVPSVHGGRGNLRETYRYYVRFLIDALGGCGIPAVLGEVYRSSPQSGAGILPALGESSEETAGGSIGQSIVESEGQEQDPLRRFAGQEMDLLRDDECLAQRGQDARATLGKSADCFAHVAANDVVEARTGAKICGCALRMTAHGVLVQASIPLRPPLVDPALVYAAPSLLSTVEVDPGDFESGLSKAISST